MGYVGCYKNYSEILGHKCLQKISSCIKDASLSVPSVGGAFHGVLVAGDGRSGSRLSVEKFHIGRLGFAQLRF